MDEAAGDPSGTSTPENTDAAAMAAVKAATNKKSGEPVVDPPEVVNAKTEAFKADASQAVLLRYSLAIGVFLLISRETSGVFDILDLQGRGVYHLNDWVVGVIIAAVFGQMGFILLAIVVHFFSEGNDKTKNWPTLPNQGGK